MSKKRRMRHIGMKNIIKGKHKAVTAARDEHKKMVQEMRYDLKETEKK